MSIRGETVSETTLDDPDDAVEFEAQDLLAERGGGVGGVTAWIIETNFKPRHA